MWRKAFFAFSKEFGWTPQQIGELTLGQVAAYGAEFQEYAAEMNRMAQGIGKHGKRR